MNEERRIKDRRVSPAIGDFSLQERSELLAQIVYLKSVEKERNALRAELAALRSEISMADEQPSAREYGDAYQGAREDLAIWKRRALESERRVHEQDQIIDHLTLEAQGETRFGEPVVSAGVVIGALVSALEGIVHDERVPNEVSQDYAALLIEARRLNHCRAQAVPDDEELKLLRAFYKCCASIADQLADSPKSALARLVEAVKDAAPPTSSDAVSVPRELLRRVVTRVILRSQEDAHADACDELRALLAQTESKVKP